MLIATLVVRIFCVVVLAGSVWLTVQVRRDMRHNRKGK